MLRGEHENGEAVGGREAGRRAQRCGWRARQGPPWTLVLREKAVCGRSLQRPLWRRDQEQGKAGPEIVTVWQEPWGQDGGAGSRHF